MELGRTKSSCMIAAQVQIVLVKPLNKHKMIGFYALSCLLPNQMLKN